MAYTSIGAIIHLTEQSSINHSTSEILWHVHKNCCTLNFLKYNTTNIRYKNTIAELEAIKQLVGFKLFWYTEMF